MSPPPDDARWSEGLDPELPRDAVELMRSGRAPLGAPDEVAELARRLSAALGPAAGLSGGSEAAGGAAGGSGLSALGGAGRGLWALGGAGAAIALGLSAWVMTRGPSDPAPREPDAVSAPEVVRAPAVSAPESPPAEPAPAEDSPAAPASPPDLEAAPPTAEPAAPEEPRRARPRAAARRRAPSDGPSETSLLEQARAALGSRPAEALELTRRHRARFPEGALAEEREVIAIEALERLGRDAAARARAAEFERRYRGSVHQPRLRRGANTSEPAGGGFNTAPP